MCAYHSDCDSAKRWTTAALKARVAEFGDKSLRADEIRETLRNPRSGEGAGHRIEEELQEDYRRRAGTIRVASWEGE